jgi:hypothetical protein
LRPYFEADHSLATCFFFYCEQIDNMGITTWLLLLGWVINVCFLFQPSLAVEYSDPPLVTMKSDPQNKIHLVVAATEVIKID